MKKFGALKPVAAASLTLLGSLANADMMACRDTPSVTVSFQEPEHAGLVCTAVKQAANLFESCNVPPLSHPVHIELVEDINAHCVGLYHCGEDLIELLSPPLMQIRRAPDGAFFHLDRDAYFQSVVVHELSHAAMDRVSCPFENCVVSTEYISYAMQVMSLDPDAQALFEQRSNLDRRVSVDEISAMILYMAPHLFAQKAWAHLSQREDACGYIAHIVDGSILLDHEHF